MIRGGPVASGGADEGFTTSVDARRARVESVSVSASGRGALVVGPVCDRFREKVVSRRERGCRGMEGKAGAADGGLTDLGRPMSGRSFISGPAYSGKMS